MTRNDLITFLKNSAVDATILRICMSIVLWVHENCIPDLLKKTTRENVDPIYLTAAEPVGAMALFIGGCLAFSLALIRKYQWEYTQLYNAAEQLESEINQLEAEYNALPSEGDNDADARAEQIQKNVTHSGLLQNYIVQQLQEKRICIADVEATLRHIKTDAPVIFSGIAGTIVAAKLLDIEALPTEDRTTVAIIATVGAKLIGYRPNRAALNA